MSWDQIIIDTAKSGIALSQQIDALLKNQRASWKMLREGEASLSLIKTKMFSQDNSQIIVQANPGRQISTRAKVDAVSVSKRPCFLCVENLPVEERGIAFDEFVIFPNPYPILQRHLTIPIRQHSPQRLEGRIESMLKLTKALGPDMLVYYNGARCGASAPDHFHFQACNSAGIPVLADLSFTGQKDEIFAYRSFGRRMFVCNDKNAEHVKHFIYRTLEVLLTFNSCTDEPMLNIISIFQNGRFLTILFPRAKHRPACYFAEDNSQISISPAALEMAGVLVVSDIDHFERVDTHTAFSIYQEVSIDDESFAKLTEAFT